MKFALKLFFLYSLLNNCATLDSKSCIEQSYVSKTKESLEKKFISEFSYFGHYKKKLFGIGDYETQKELKNAEELCACAMYQMKKKTAEEGSTVESFKDILKQMSIETIEIWVPIPYFCIPIKHYFPAIRCIKSKEQITKEVEKNFDICIVSKGTKRKSNVNRIYDMYIQGEGKLSRFQGMIEQVDVELPVNEISPNVR